MTGYQMNKKTLFLWIYVILYPALLLLLMLVPNNQYEVMNDYSYVEQTNGQLSLALMNMATVVEIMALAILIVLGVLGLLTAKLHTNRLETIVAIIVAFSAFVFHSTFYICGVIADNTIGDISHVTLGNLLVYVCHFFFLASFVYLSIRFVFRPYKEIEKESLSKNESQQNIESQEETEYEKRMKYRYEMKNFDKERMSRYLKEKYESGELSKEQYEQFMNDLEG